MKGMNADVSADLQPKGSKRSIFSWCLYDWANSAFSTLIITFVFSVFFSRGMIGDETQGAALWAYAIGVSGCFVAVLGPLFGSVADHSGSRKGWILFFSLLCIIPTALLYCAQPTPEAGNVLRVLTLVIIANIGFELAGVFYNAMLPHVAPPHMMGRVSGWAWGLGYIGGLISLALALFGLIGFGEMEPLLPVSGADSANVRASGLLAAMTPVAAAR
jgi:UMF1 family MFS transporter